MKHLMHFGYCFSLISESGGQRSNTKNVSSITLGIAIWVCVIAHAIAIRPDRFGEFIGGKSTLVATTLFLQKET